MASRSKVASSMAVCRPPGMTSLNTMVLLLTSLLATFPPPPMWPDLPQLLFRWQQLLTMLLLLCTLHTLDDDKMALVHFAPLETPRATAMAMSVEYLTV